MNVVTHSIGGLVFRTEVNAWLPRIFEEPFALFGIEEAKPDIRQLVFEINPDAGDVNQPIDGEMSDFSASDLFPPDRRNSCFFRSAVVRNRLNVLPDLKEQAVIWVDDHHLFIRDFSLNRIDIYYTQKDRAYPPQHPGAIPEYHVAANFQQMLATFLPVFAATLLHCSGVIRGGKAALFVAPDDGGKTTVLAHANGVPVLSDDQIIVRKEGDVAVAHATPLGVMTSGPCQAPVGALFMLEKGSTFQIDPVSPAEIVQYLWSEHHNYTFFLPKHLKQRAFRLLCDLCYRIPTYLMRFSKDYVNWDAIDAAMVNNVVENG